QLTGNDEWDGAGSVGVGILLACAAFIVGYETKSLLIGESATEEDSRKIIAALEAGPERFKAIHLRTSHIGPESLPIAPTDARPGRADRGGSGSGHQRGRGAHPGNPADRGDHLPGTGHLPPRRDRRHRPLRPGRKKKPQPPPPRPPQPRRLAPGRAERALIA